jgi:hypothetical protein
MHIRRLLLTCRAPLRNRTVDLLLTIDTQQVPLIAVEALNWADAGSRELSQAEASARELGLPPDLPPT